MIGLLNKTTPIGLDVGACGVRAVQLRRNSDGWAVRYVARYDCDGDETARPSSAAPLPPEVVKACFSTAEFSGRRVVTALDSPVAQFHALELPPGISPKGSELARAVAFEVERLSSAPPGGLEVRHWPLPEPRGAAPNAIGMAVPREAVMDAIGSCGTAGLNCSKVDAAAAALGRFGSLLGRWGSEVAWGILDIGSDQTRLVLCVDDVPVLIRPAGTGGAAWTQAIAESLQISLKAAEVQKCEVGLGKGRPGGQSDSPGEPDEELGALFTGILRRHLTDIASEIKQSYEYVLGCYPSCRASDLILVGGGAGLHNLPEHLANLLGIEVHQASYYLNRAGCRLQWTVPRQNRVEEFALAVGLCLEGGA